MDGAADGAVSWRRIALPAYGPSLVGSIGHGAVAPVLALAARDLGASVSVAALFVALAALAEFVCSVPVGLFVDRVGERLALTIGGVLEVVAGVIGWFAPSLWALVIAVAVLGPAGGIFIVARQSFLGHLVPPHQRARAMSTLGGVARIGWFIGPLLAAPFIALHGARAAFLVLSAGGALAAAVTWWSMDLPELDGVSGSGRPGEAPPPLRVTIRRHARVLVTLGLGVLTIGLARSSRMAIVPLWAEHIGVQASQVAVLMGVAMGLEALLFYPAGWVMDRFGRVWIAAPVAISFGLALLSLPLATSYAVLAAVVVAMAVANGMGSGIVMTLGADAAPAVGRAGFLGVWRLISLVGANGAALLVSLIAAVAGLGAASLAVGLLSIAGGGWLAHWVPKWDPRRTPSARER
jgi:MFS family permease